MRVDDISNVSTIEEVHAMKRAHKGGTWKYACACRSGVRYEGESEAWDQLKTMIKERGAAAEDVRDASEGRGIEGIVEDASENDPFASKDTVPVPPEDRAPGELRGAGARSPLFWKLMLVAMALIWGYSFLTMKTVLDTVPTFMLLACRFLLSAVIMFIIFHKRIKAHFNREYLGFGVLMGCVIWSAYAAQTLGLVDTTPGKNAFLTGTYCIKAHFNREYLGFGVLMGCVIWSAYAAQTLGLVDTTPGKNAFLTGTYCILVPFIALILFKERVTKWHIASALLCLVGVGFVALDNFSIQMGDLMTLVGAVFFAVDMAVVGHIGRTRDVSVLTSWMFAVDMAVVGHIGRTRDVSVLTSWMFLFVGLFSLAATTAFEPRVPAEQWTPEIIGQLVFLAVVCTTIGLLLQNQALSHVPPATGSAFEPRVPAEQWTPEIIGQLVFLAVVCTTIGLLLQNQALSHVPPATGSLLLSLESPSGVLFSVLMAGEVLTGKLIFGFVLIFLSIVLSETHFSFLRKWFPKK